MRQPVCDDTAGRRVAVRLERDEPVGRLARIVVAVPVLAGRVGGLVHGRVGLQRDLVGPVGIDGDHARAERVAVDGENPAGSCASARPGASSRTSMTRGPPRCEGTAIARYIHSGSTSWFPPEGSCSTRPHLGLGATCGFGGKEGPCRMLAGSGRGLPAGKRRADNADGLAPSPGRVTDLLGQVRGGDKDALATLLPLVYDELKRVAASHLQRERPDHTLQATALVHEVYVRLVDRTALTWENRAHFFGVAAQAMRQILVDHARGRARVEARRQAAPRDAGRGAGRQRGAVDRPRSPSTKPSRPWRRSTRRRRASSSCGTSAG